MSNSYLRLIEGELGGLDDEETSLHALLSPFCPQPEVTPGGKQYFEPDDVKRLDGLFERFGLGLRSSDDAFDDTEYVLNLWYRLTENYGSYVVALAFKQRQAERMMAAWPPGHKAYLEAVIGNDRGKAVILADLLGVADLDAWCPRGYLARQN
jgi:hypothetical protein